MGRHVRIVTASLFAAAILAGAAGPASASCMGYADPEAEFRKAIATSPVVFVGTVFRTQNAGRTAIVAVQEVWRGAAVPGQVVVHGSPSSDMNAVTSVDRTFTLGTRYLFLPGGKRSPFSDGACSFTREFTPDLLQLRPAGETGPPEQPPPADDSSGFPIGGVALGSGGGVALLVVLWMALRRRDA